MPLPAKETPSLKLSTTNEMAAVTTTSASLRRPNEPADNAISLEFPIPIQQHYTIFIGVFIGASSPDYICGRHLGCSYWIQQLPCGRCTTFASSFVSHSRRSLHIFFLPFRQLYIFLLYKFALNTTQLFRCFPRTSCVAFFVLVTSTLNSGGPKTPPSPTRLLCQPLSCVLIGVRERTIFCRCSSSNDCCA